jgi:BirA family biotin operon repressor/biotin-[acetyl-CoA-carboxylase] ligase
MSAVTQTQLSLGELRNALVGTRFAANLQHFASVDSTNTLLLEAAANGAPEGTVYLADEQTAGRGRGGHTWHSAPGDGLYFSVLVQPPLLLEDALHLSLATGLAAQQAIHEITGVSVDIRWPNDLLVGKKKLGGILVETAVEPGPNPMLRYAVIGIGINVSQQDFPGELATIATSLALEAHESIIGSVSRQPLLVGLLRQLDIELMRLEGTSMFSGSNLLQRFTERSSWVSGKRVQVPEQGGYTGTTAGLNPQGFLLVDADDGIQRTVLSGGVREL